MHLFNQILVMILLLICAASCTSRSLEEFQEEGEGIIRSLIQELQAIHTREQLLAASGRIQKDFDRLVTLMIAAQELRDAHSNVDKEELIQPNHELSDQLRMELNRLYRLEGGRQIIEKCQEKALHRLLNKKINVVD